MDNIIIKQSVKTGLKQSEALMIFVTSEVAPVSTFNP